ncbi:MAG: RHS repeat-associated core domain-containing protein [Actinomycetota bacterium]|nr:RHS repeat-associated core domain-containing protein [Actinomycetota bacterium]MDP3631200.1 RHS repeat-associated core domain-containing protein [Actinomycetota bacterium]
MCPIDSDTQHAFYGYDAFGRPTETTTTPTASLDATTAAEVAAANPLRYAGYCYDGFSGLYYLSQRYYDPATAQFITKDPAKADGEESAYQYCGGDPVGKVDPTGERKSLIYRTETVVKSWYGNYKLNANSCHGYSGKWYCRVLVTLHTVYIHEVVVDAAALYYGGKSGSSQGVRKMGRAIASSAGAHYTKKSLTATGYVGSKGDYWYVQFYMTGYIKKWRAGY